MVNSGHVPGQVRRFDAIVAFVMLAGLIAGLVIASGQPADAGVRRLCQRGQHIQVTSHDGRKFSVRDDFWGTRRFCLKNVNKRPNFKVTRAGRNLLGGGVMSFPYVFTGCSWSICTRDSGLPARASSLRHPRATWHTTGRARGQWNASFDLWFGKRRMTTGQATGAELMIWLNARRLPLDSRRIVWADGVRWYLAHWKARARHGRKRWNYIQFRRVHPKRGVRNLRLNPFIHRAEHFRLVKRWWWLLNIEAGFEVHSGGKGLSGRRFWARP
jgi:hypothetical protein